MSNCQSRNKHLKPINFLMWTMDICQFNKITIVKYISPQENLHRLKHIDIYSPPSVIWVYFLKWRQTVSTNHKQLFIVFLAVDITSIHLSNLLKILKYNYPNFLKKQLWIFLIRIRSYTTYKVLINPYVNLFFPKISTYKRAQVQMPHFLLEMYWHWQAKFLFKVDTNSVIRKL